jgi:uncharacterized protein (TIGR00730 family)
VPPMSDASIPPVAAAALDALIDALAPVGGPKWPADLLRAAAQLVAERPESLDGKIAAAAVREMSEAFRVFAPYRDISKVTIFGSARTSAEDPMYAQARDVARRLADLGWMTVTGAGPGIMQAGMEGAGREHSIGVSIRLPFEQGANSVIAGDHKYVAMKYFFTRKLMLIKESKGFVCLPGGFGTLDETFELLTLTQTGKGLPVPIVLLDTPREPYWLKLHEFIVEQVVPRGLVSPLDTQLYLVTDSADRAVQEITSFYANYDSIRYVGDTLVVRLHHEPTDAQLADLNEAFGHLCVTGTIQRSGPLGAEAREGDALDLHRIAFTFAKHGFGELRRMIDMVNRW